MMEGYFKAKTLLPSSPKKKILIKYVDIHFEIKISK